YDRIGSGDSFASGFIYGLLAGQSFQWAVGCGAAHGALAMTTPGDTSMVTLKEVLQVMEGASGRITSEINKEEVRRQIIGIGIVPVLRVSSPKLAMAAAEAVLAGGIPIVEVTMTIPKAVDVIRELVMSMSSDVIVGAGTVLDAQAAQQCLDSGAEFLVSPVF